MDVGQSLAHSQMCIVITTIVAAIIIFIIGFSVFLPPSCSNVTFSGKHFLSILYKI